MGEWSGESCGLSVVTIEAGAEMPVHGKPGKNDETVFPMYDKVSLCQEGFSLFEGIGKRPRGDSGVKSAFFALIWTLDAAAATPTMTLGTKLGFFSELRSIVGNPSSCVDDQNARLLNKI